MKKTLILILILCLAVSISACGSVKSGAASRVSPIPENGVVSQAPQPIQIPTQESVNTDAAQAHGSAAPQTGAVPQTYEPKATPAENAGKAKPQGDQAQSTPAPAVVATPSEAQQEAPKALTVSITINCRTARDNYDKLDKSAKDDRTVPPGGQIFSAKDVELTQGETVFDVLKRICRDNRIHMESSYTPVSKAAYIEGINNLYEFAAGSLSGWMYCVNDKYPNYSSSSYVLKDGDDIQWNYTCDLGRDLGQDGVVQQSK